MRINLSVRNALILICVVYTLLTVTSSIYGLVVGRITDTNVHLLLRFLITAIGIGSILIFNLFPRWNLVGIFALHYGLVMGFILIVIWASGLFIELHTDAYRDIFLNFTPIYLVVAACFLIKDKYKKY